MAGNNEAELVRLMNNAIKGIGELRVSNDDLKSGQVRIESQLEKLENQLKIVENDVKSVQTEVEVVSKKLTHSINGVDELRARVEILEEKLLSTN